MYKVNIKQYFPHLSKTTVNKKKRGDKGFFLIFFNQ